MSLLNQLASSVQDTLTFYKRRRQFDDLFKYIRKKAPNESALRQVRELNALLDHIVDDFAQQLRLQKLETVPVRDVRHTFSRKWMGLTVTGTFHADVGTVRDLSSIRRKDNCGLDIPRATERVFSFNLSFRRAVLDVEQYELHCGPINTKGRLSVEVRDNLISVRVTMELKKGDKLQRVEVTRAEVTKCGDYKIRVTGFGPLGGNRLAKVIIKLALKNQINQRKKELEEQLKLFIKRTIESYTL